MMKQCVLSIVLTFSVACLSAAENLPDAAELVLDPSHSVMFLRHSGQDLGISLLAPEMTLEGGLRVGGSVPSGQRGDLSSGDVLEIAYEPQGLPDGGRIEQTLCMQWHKSEGVLRKWATVRLEDSVPRTLEEAVLEAMPADGGATLEATPPQSYPVFVTGFFAGIEFPVASTRVEGDHVLIAHRPGVTLQPGVSYTTRKAVFGVAPVGTERRAFKDYIARRRPSPKGLHVNYNSWWTSSVPFTEEEILKIMADFEQNLFTPHGVSLDTFTIDMGWSESRSLWGISGDRFPEGFSSIQRATEQMNAHLGLWISPTGFYGPASIDVDWAGEQGYETMSIPWFGGETRICCLGGRRYATAFRERLVDMITRYGIRHVKLDGYYLTCSENGHGHAAGALSCEAIAEGGIAAFEAMHAAAPDVWLEATCFGWNPSPWWLWYVNSVIGTYGDDAPHGRVPAPVYRESYTTARDYFNLQGAEHLNVPIPAQEVLGIIHQTNEPFVNDAVDVIMRGHGFLTMYVNPKYMDAPRWKALAGCIDWARKNPLIFERTEAIQPASWREGGVPRFTNDAPMPREPYGYAHWGDTTGLAGVRNPWIAPAVISIPINTRDASTAGLMAVSLYPEPRVYGTALRAGETLEVPLAPYETVVLCFDASLPLAGLPRGEERVGGHLRVSSVTRRLVRVEYEGESETQGPDWTALTEPGTSGAALDLDAKADVGSLGAKLLVLLEGAQTPTIPAVLQYSLDGKELPLRVGASDTGWSASVVPKAAERWQWLEADMPADEHRIALKLSGGGDCERLSVWLYATRPGGFDSGYPNALPSPETLSLDAVALLEPVDVASLTETERRPLDVRRIEGVYLDALEPVSATQGWGTLQRNRSVTETPLIVCGERFTRGLGTHADARIIYDLGGQYARFITRAGASVTSTATITFEVWTDGEKRWESGSMTPTDPAKEVDLDVAGAQQLELIVGDAGNGIGSDHANWGDARLLR